MSRLASDNYPTPQPLADAICACLISERIVHCPEQIIEPSAGEGVFVRAARRAWPQAHIAAIDVRQTQRECVAAGANVFWTGDWVQALDCLDMLVMHPFEPVVVLGNPPYSFAQSHVERALEMLADDSVIAFLLRLSFLGSVGRAALWARRELRYLIPVIGRPAFVNGKTDHSEYAVFVWQVGFKGNAEVLPGLEWRK